MKILTVDIGTGTQDIFLYDSKLDMENGFKLVLPSATMRISQQIKAATRQGTPLVLSGWTMGGGPCAWAAEAHARAGLPLYATPAAARTFNDELDKVERMGIKIVSEEEARALPARVQRLELRDFDFALIAETFARFQAPLDNLAAVCVAVFDHGNAPPGVSDRKFRFDYLDQRIRARNSLTSFAFLAENTPPIMTRLQAVAHSAVELPCPLILMDTAPAAILGATFDPAVRARPRKLIVNVGNFHTIAFRLGETGIEGVFEHHTGEIDRPKLEKYIRALADGTLTNKDVFDDMGHGALVYGKETLPLGNGDYDIIVTGPRRSLFQSARHEAHSLRPYFAVPFGDMMLSGNFGMLSAASDLLPPEAANAIRASLQTTGSRGVAPWDA